MPARSRLGRHRETNLHVIMKRNHLHRGQGLPMARAAERLPAMHCYPDYCAIRPRYAAGEAQRTLMRYRKTHQVGSRQGNKYCHPMLVPTERSQHAVVRLYQDHQEIHAKYEAVHMTHSILDGARPNRRKVGPKAVGVLPQGTC